MEEEKELNAKISLETHSAKFHENMDQHKCEICEYVFSAESELENHFSDVHQNEGKTRTTLSCNICTKTFQAKRTLNLHLRIFHEGKKNYKCESCGKSFSRAENLKKHIHTIHEGHTKIAD